MIRCIIDILIIARKETKAQAVFTVPNSWIGDRYIGASGDLRPINPKGTAQTGTKKVFIGDICIHHYPLITSISTTRRDTSRLRLFDLDKQIDLLFADSLLFNIHFFKKTGPSQRTLAIFKIRIAIEVAGCKIDVSSNYPVFGDIVSGDDDIIDHHFFAMGELVLEINSAFFFIFVKVWVDFGVSITKISHFFFEIFHIQSHLFDIKDFAFSEF